MPSALLTGGTGFVGGELAAALCADGWDVHVIVRASSSAEAVARLRGAGCVAYTHDGSRASLGRAVDGAAPDCTWHLATRFIGHHAPADVGPLVRDNVEFGALLLDALSTRGRPAVVTAGSLWQQYGNATYSPLSLYAATKEAFDAIATYYAEVLGFRVVECMLTDTYGPSDRRRKLLWHLREAARTGTALAMSGEGAQYIDLLHVNDAVRALITAGERAVAAPPGSLERWAVRPGHPIAVRELVERVGRALRRPVPVQWGARPGRPREMTVPWTAGAVLPGWQARIALDDGLREFA